MKHVHWIVTGLSSIPGIRRLAKNLENLTVWNRTLEKVLNKLALSAEFSESSTVIAASITPGPVSVWRPSRCMSMSKHKFNKSL